MAGIMGMQHFGKMNYEELVNDLEQFNNSDKKAYKSIIELRIAIAEKYGYYDTSLEDAIANVSHTYFQLGASDE